MTLRLAPLTAAALIALTCGASGEPSDSAQAIAQKFYEASQPEIATKPKAVVQAAPVAKPALIVQSTLVAQSTYPGAGYETEMLNEARAELIERQKTYSETSKAHQIPLAAPSELGGHRLPLPVAPLPVIAQGPSQQPAPAPASEATTAPQPRVVPKAAATPAASDTPQAPWAPPAAAAQSETKGQHATVLVVLDDTGRSPGVRPDPILCFDQQCWISNGLEAPAKPMPRSTALALKTTATPTGDSCSGKSACAFRNIPIAPDAPVELVEVGESRGVGRGGYTIAADTTCRKDGDELLCSNPLVTHEFRMWVVPENTAQAAGPLLLESAIADSLPDSDGTSDDGK